jgi:putative flippase GtrA
LTEAPETTHSAVEARPPSTGLAGRVKTLVYHKEFERFSKFLVVGTLGAAIDFATFRGLDALDWFEPVTLTLPFGLRISEAGTTGGIAFLLAVISNFLWNRYWTYPDSRTKPMVSQFVTFLGINAAGLLIRTPILEYLSTPFGNLEHSLFPQVSEQTVIAMGRSTAWVLAVLIVLFWNFFVNRYWTYNDVK